MHRFIALVGMAGSGKSVVADELIRQGYQFFRFGQITMDIIKEKGLEINEINERAIRENVRKEHGMGAYALLNIPKIEKFLVSGHVVGDGLYSWSEYKILRKKFGNKMFVIAVYAPPALRYERLSARKRLSEDKDIRFRQITSDQARSRDFAEIENIEKAGPIAMADFTLLNTGNIQNLIDQLNTALNKIEDKK
ncbi:MAG: AAA family ATPase [Cyclobacteriaceae bacterium]|nr:AAA family ATPase [Cyclobacteriaceae bacterium]